MDIFEAMEQFKREHPEYDQAKDSIEIAREAMEAYQRYLDSRKATYVFTTTSSAKRQMCFTCGGVGRIRSSRITTAGYEEFTCPTCHGAGGWFSS